VVVEMLATDGDILKEGQPVLTFEQPNSPLQAVVYLPANGAARRLRPGMPAEISPATTERALDGYLLGKVRAVSKYPATEAGMMSLINNAPLVQALMKHGPPIAVDVDLIPDAGSADGYRWSSRRGQAQILSSGLLASGAFVTDTRRPISLIFPRLHDAQGR